MPIVTLRGSKEVRLFPPSELPNLYQARFDAGGNNVQDISEVDVWAPDPSRFPRFAAALNRSTVARLAPGDAAG